MKTYKFNLSNLDCATCATKIEHGIQEMAEINQANVNFAKQMLQVETELDYDNATLLIEKKIRQLEPDVSIKETLVKDYRIWRIGISLLLFVFGFALQENFYLLFASYLIIGYDIILKSLRNIFHGEVFDEFFLMTIATIGAFYIGEFPEGVAVMLFFQIGEYLQDRAVRQSRKSISALMDLKSDVANLKRNGKVEQVDPAIVKIGDIIVCRPGDRVPLDGVVIKGSSNLDTSMLTGESQPRMIQIKDEVLSGCVNLSGAIEIKVTKELKEATVTKILDMIENATNKKTKTEHFITRFARIYTPIVVGLAILITVIPVCFLQLEFSSWLYRSLVFLVISCPCALVISIPLGFFSGIGLESRHGILVKGSDALEMLGKVTTIVFDKTGTLTEGKFGVSTIVTNGKWKPHQVLEYAAFAESYSTHPIAQSILEEYGKLIDLKFLSNYEQIPGKGVKVDYIEDQILVGNQAFMEEEHVEVVKTNSFGTIVYVALNHQYVGYLVIEDKPKPGIKKMIRTLTKMGKYRLIVLSGDNETVVRNVCKRVGISEYRAEMLPQEKATFVEQLEAKETVMFLGDGINDALVLTKASIGVSMGGIGSDAAIEASDIVIMNDDVTKITEAIRISKKTAKVIWQNIIFAIFIKVVVLIAGIVGMTTIWLAVFADVGVTLITILNTARLMYLK